MRETPVAVEQCGYCLAIPNDSEYIGRRKFVLKFKLEGKFPVLNGGWNIYNGSQCRNCRWWCFQQSEIRLGVDATSSPKTLLTTILDGSVVNDMGAQLAR